MKTLAITFTAVILAASVSITTAHLPSGPFKLKESHVTYKVEPDKSSFVWEASKVSGDHTGTVDIADGRVTYNKGMLLGGYFEMDMRTISNTDIESEKWKNKLIGHLKSEDFFSVDTHPTAQFKVKVWAPIKDAKEGASNYYIKGDLTIKGITRELTFPAMVDLSEEALRANAEFEVDRTDFDIRFRSGKFFPDVGDKMIEDMFKVRIELVASAQAAN